MNKQTVTKAVAEIKTSMNCHDASYLLIGILEAGLAGDHAATLRDLWKAVELFEHLVKTEDAERIRLARRRSLIAQMDICSTLNYAPQPDARLLTGE